jgi:hypothetical protein
MYYNRLAKKIPYLPTVRAIKRFRAKVLSQVFFLFKKLWLLLTNLIWSMAPKLYQLLSQIKSIALKAKSLVILGYKVSTRTAIKIKNKLATKFVLRLPLLDPLIANLRHLLQKIIDNLKLPVELKNILHEKT